MVKINQNWIKEAWNFCTELYIEKKTILSFLIFFFFT